MVNEKRTTDRHSTARVLIIVALITIALSTFVFLLEAHLESKRDQIEIQRRLDAIRAAGQPVTAQDLAKLYPDPPPDHDAVLLLKPALSGLVVPKNSKNLPFFGAALPTGSAVLEKPMRDEIQLCMDQNQKAFDSIPTEKLKGAWIGSGISGGFTNFSNVSNYGINSLVKLLCLDAISQAESRHPSEATHSLQQALAVGATWENNWPIDLMLRTIEDNMIFESLEFMINRSQLSNDDLTTVERSLPRDNTNDLTEICISERCRQIWGMELVGENAKRAAMSGGSPWHKVFDWYNSISGKVYRDSDFELLLDRSAQRIAATKLPYKQCLDKLESLNPGVENDGRPGSLALELAEGNVNIYPGYARGNYEGIARLRIIRAVLGVERWCLAHNGNVPDSLAELAPNFIQAIPTDPFDDQPLRYKKLAHGYVVYSIGTDFTDDGGKPEPVGAKDTDHYDITFTVER